MQLLWLFYGGKRSRYILLLELGRHDGRICGIDTQGIHDNDRRKIMSASKVLADCPLQKRVSWIKHHCPRAMDNYREISEANAKVHSMHSIGTMNVG